MVDVEYGYARQFDKLLFAPIALLAPAVLTFTECGCQDDRKQCTLVGSPDVVAYALLIAQWLHAFVFTAFVSFQFFFQPILIVLRGHDFLCQGLLAVFFVACLLLTVFQLTIVIDERSIRFANLLQRIDADKLHLGFKRSL